MLDRKTMRILAIPRSSTFLSFDIFLIRCLSFSWNIFCFHISKLMKVQMSLLQYFDTLSFLNSLNTKNHITRRQSFLMVIWSTSSIWNSLVKQLWKFTRWWCFLALLCGFLEVSECFLERSMLCLLFHQLLLHKIGTLLFSASKHYRTIKQVDTSSSRCRMQFRLKHSKLMFWWYTEASKSADFTLNRIC